MTDARGGNVEPGKDFSRGECPDCGYQVGDEYTVRAEREAFEHSREQIADLTLRAVEAEKERDEALEQLRTAEGNSEGAKQDRRAAIARAEKAEWGRDADNAAAANNVYRCAAILGAPPDALTLEDECRRVVAERDEARADAGAMQVALDRVGKNLFAHAAEVDGLKKQLAAAERKYADEAHSNEELEAQLAAAESRVTALEGALRRSMQYVAIYGEINAETKQLVSDSHELLAPPATASETASEHEERCEYCGMTGTHTEDCIVGHVTFVHLPAPPRVEPATVERCPITFTEWRCELEVGHEGLHHFDNGERPTVTAIPVSPDGGGAANGEQSYFDKFMSDPRNRAIYEEECAKADAKTIDSAPPSPTPAPMAVAVEATCNACGGYLAPMCPCCSASEAAFALSHIENAVEWLTKMREAALSALTPKGK
jgi:hypothetical protein